MSNFLLIGILCLFFIGCSSELDRLENRKEQLDKEISEKLNEYELAGKHCQAANAEINTVEKMVSAGYERNKQNAERVCRELLVATQEFVKVKLEREDLENEIKLLKQE